jgi:hypothetical protein
MTENDLSPNDLKARVLAHFKAPTPERLATGSALLDLCESGFERDVFSALIECGYHVTSRSIWSSKVKVDAALPSNAMAIAIRAQKSGPTTCAASAFSSVSAGPFGAALAQTGASIAAQFSMTFFRRLSEARSAPTVQ